MEGESESVEGTKIHKRPAEKFRIDQLTESKVKKHESLVRLGEFRTIKWWLMLLNYMSRQLIAVAVFSAALSSPVPQEAVSRAGSVGAASAAFPASGGVATARTHHKFKKKHGFGTLPLYPGLYGYKPFLMLAGSLYSER